MTDTELIKYGIRLIAGQEGAYTSVVASDNGIMGMGIFGFRGSNAGTLLCNIVKAGGKVADWIRKNTQTGNMWAQRAATAAEVVDLRAAIGTEIGRKCQDDMAGQYVSGNIKRARNAGLTQESAILYYCDFANQYGPNSSRLKSITTAAVKEGGTLDAMYAQTCKQTSSYLARRGRIYNQLKADFETPKPSDTKPENTPDTAYKTDIDWACAAGLLSKDEKGDLRPKESCTRQELAQFGHRLYTLIKGGK